MILLCFLLVNSATPVGLGTLFRGFEVYLRVYLFYLPERGVYLPNYRIYLPKPSFYLPSVVFYFRAPFHNPQEKNQLLLKEAGLAKYFPSSPLCYFPYFAGGIILDFNIAESCVWLHVAQLLNRFFFKLLLPGI